ncbi:MAG TPA: hypothetical protein VLH61_10490, partial [Bacteroidales bacterium]|nr:hypothetical protein [Bacteroidales bacterium]
VRLKARYFPNNSDGSILQDFTLNGLQNQKFLDRIESFLQSQKSRYPFLNTISIEIESQSTFPHSAGIASSAAAFSALALVLETFSQQLGYYGTTPKDFFTEASITARLGSGSACRSVYGGFSLWGKTPAFEGSSDSYSIRIDQKDIHQVFDNIRDAILIADDGEKPVSSSRGHALMQNHPFRETRIAQAGKNLENLLHALKTGEEQLFIEILENEALTLHGLMMTSNPGYVLMKPATLSMIDKIRDFRKNTNIQSGFTVDAGPNIHLIYLDKDKGPVREFISNELAGLCRNGKWIDDGVGGGPIPLTF